MKRLLPAVALAAGASFVGAGAAIADAGVGPPPVGAVQNIPASYTPSIADTTRGQVIRQLTPCNGDMYAAGKFSLIKQGGVTVTRNNIFSFSATTGALNSFDPNVNGKVNTVALSSDCSVAYLGGSFTSIGGVAVKNIAAVSTSTGAVISTFGHSASQVNNILTLGTSHLLVGSYGTVNGSTDKYLTSVSPVTGKDDGYLKLNISGNYVFPGSGNNSTQGYNMELDSTGTKLLVEGDFTSVGALHREQIFMLDLGATSGEVNGWNSQEFYGNCNGNETFYIQAADFSPDGSTVYLATTGYKPYGSSTTAPRTGLCDAAAAFSSAPSEQTHLWINYAGCDSLYALVADNSAVYVGGHQRRLNAPVDCDENNITPGPTAPVAAPGMGGLNPASGSVYTKATDPFTGYYSRSRGTGADDMILTAQGLWIASDNGSANSFSQTCGGKTGHAGICLLPH
jgi:hypothetical protein